MGTLPFALTGGFWILYLLGYHQSVATGVGFIALAGVAAEFGVVMLIYLKNALEERGPRSRTPAEVEAAVREGAVLRVRPKAMTVAVILAGLLPILLGPGAGSEVMSRIAAPMIGGMITAPLLSMFVIPAAYLLLRRPRRGTCRNYPRLSAKELNMRAYHTALFAVAVVAAAPTLAQSISGNIKDMSGMAHGQQGTRREDRKGHRRRHRHRPQGRQGHDQAWSDPDGGLARDDYDVQGQSADLAQGPACRPENRVRRQDPGHGGGSHRGSAAITM